MRLAEISDAGTEPEEISVLLSADVLDRCGLNIALESVWVKAGYKDWMYRVDPEDPKIPQKRHIHIARSKHTSAKNMQASWNSDGTRHDKKSFSTQVGNINQVREIARSVLKIDPEIALESENQGRFGKALIEDISSSADGKIAYLFLDMV